MTAPASALPPELRADPDALADWLAATSDANELSTRMLAAAEEAAAFNCRLAVFLSRSQHSRWRLLQNPAFRQASNLSALLAEAVGEPTEDFPLHYLALVGEARDQGLIPIGSPAWAKLQARLDACGPDDFDQDACTAASIMLSASDLTEDQLVAIAAWLPADDGASGLYHQVAAHPHAGTATFRALAAKFPALGRTAWAMALDFQQRPAAFEDDVVMAACSTLFQRKIGDAAVLENLTEHPIAGVLAQRMMDRATTDDEWQRAFIGLMHHFPFVAAMRIRRHDDPRIETLPPEALYEVLQVSDSTDLKAAVYLELISKPRHGPGGMRRGPGGPAAPAVNPSPAPAATEEPMTPPAARQRPSR